MNPKNIKSNNHLDSILIIRRTTMKSIVLTGGGTAGHVMPNIALLPHLTKHFDEIYYIGSHNGIEKKIISQYPNVKYIEIDTVKLLRKITLRNLLIPFRLIKAISQSKKILKQINPSVIFSKGGYVAVPVVLAAASLHIPIIAHESDSSIGLANKIIYRKCTAMYFSFREAMNGYEKKGHFSGSPVRPEFLTKDYSRPNIKLDKEKKTILVVGGSLGAKALNKIIIESLPILSDYNVINIVGKGNTQPNTYPNYHQLEYVDNISDYFKISDIIISRAGSNTIFEILATKTPMILIPLPKTESRGDQIINANIFQDKGYSIVMEQENITPNRLISTIKDVLVNQNTYIKNMQKCNDYDGVDIIKNKIEQF